jgi:hypothetical protein
MFNQNKELAKFKSQAKNITKEEVTVRKNKERDASTQLVY